MSSNFWLERFAFFPYIFVHTFYTSRRYRWIGSIMDDVNFISFSSIFILFKTYSHIIIITQFASEHWLQFEKYIVHDHVHLSIEKVKNWIKINYETSVHVMSIDLRRRANKNLLDGNYRKNYEIFRYDGCRQCVENCRSGDYNFNSN